MSKNKNNDTIFQFGYKPMKRGYQPKKLNEGYQPTKSTTTFTYTQSSPSAPTIPGRQRKEY